MIIFKLVDTVLKIVENDIMRLIICVIALLKLFDWWNLYWNWAIKEIKKMRGK